MFRRIYLVVSCILHVGHTGASSPFNRCEWVMWVYPIRNLASITSSLLILLWPVRHSPIASCISWSLFWVWLSHDFCHLSDINFFMVGFSSVYGTFDLHISIWKTFFSALSAFSFPWMPMWLGIQGNIMLLFLERVFSLFKSFVIRGGSENLLTMEKIVTS